MRFRTSVNKHKKYHVMCYDKIQTWSASDDVANMLLSTMVKCIEEKFEL